MTNKRRKQIGSLLISLVFAGIVSSATWQVFNPKNLWFYLQKPQDWAVPATPQHTLPDIQTQTPPTGITFPSLEKSLVVSAGVIRNGEWDLFDDKAAWLATSAVPGEGNVIIYAHNTKNLFGDLNQLKVGDLIEVTQADTRHRYQVRERRKINPNQVEAILSPNNQLTLYTCEGSFDQKRLVVYADKL